MNGVVLLFLMPPVCLFSWQKGTFAGGDAAERKWWALSQLVPFPDGFKLFNPSPVRPPSLQTHSYALWDVAFRSDCGCWGLISAYLSSA